MLLEAAVWEPTGPCGHVHGAAGALEASRRFERGVDLELPPMAQRRALGLLQQVAGGTVAAGMIDASTRGRGRRWCWT